jgi:hypothetical protein
MGFILPIEKQEGLMTIKRNWPKWIAIAIFFTLMGGYYDRLSAETRTFILPLVIFAAAAFVLGRLKQLEYEVRSSRLTALEVVAQNISLADTEGNERMSISASADTGLLTFYDDNRDSRLSLQLTKGEPVLKLVGERGSAILTIERGESPRFIMRDEAEEIIWSAP